MKKFFIIFLAGVFLLAGCGQEAETEQPAAAPVTSRVSPTFERVEEEVPLHDTVDLPAQDGDVIEIPERLFIAQTNDIYLNGEDYIGKTLRYEGLYKNSEEWDDQIEEVIHYVIRYGPGCCGYDGEAGFEVRWDGEWPRVDDWVEVEGVLREERYDSGYKLLYVDVTSLTVKDERGAEYVAT